MPRPIYIDVSGLGEQFGLSQAQIDDLTERCVQAVTAAVYANWEALAKQGLNSTRPEYLQNLNIIDRGRFAKSIVLTGELPVMLEAGATPFDQKEYFQRSSRARHTVPVLRKDGTVLKPGGDWYLTVPFRHGTPGTVGQAGFSGEMPQEVYDVVRTFVTGQRLRASQIPTPYNVPAERRAIAATDRSKAYAAYIHKHSIYEGITKQTGVYARTTQNTYVSFRRASKNSDPLSWIFPGLTARRFADKALDQTDVETIVHNESVNFIESL